MIILDEYMVQTLCFFWYSIGKSTILTEIENIESFQTWKYIIVYVLNEFHNIF